MVITQSTQEDAGLDAAFLAARRSELLAQLASHREQVERLSAAAAELAFERAAQDGGDDEGFGEGNALDVEREGVLALAGAAQRRSEEIAAALARLDAGNYGTCSACHEPIAGDRLEVLPETSHCVSCKSGSSLRARHRARLAPSP